MFLSLQNQSQGATPSYHPQRFIIKKEKRKLNLENENHFSSAAVLPTTLISERLQHTLLIFHNNL